MHRRPVGRTLTRICLDPGIVPAFRDSDFFTGYLNVIRRYGGRLAPPCSMCASAGKSPLRKNATGARKPGISIGTRCQIPPCARTRGC